MIGCQKNNDFFEIYKEFYSAYPSELIRTNDGGFMIVGWGRSLNNHNSNNGIAIKLDSKGDRQWQKEYGSSKSFQKFKYAISLDNGHYFLGGTKDNNVWITKIDSFGNILLNKEFINNLPESAESACYDSLNNSLFIIGNSSNSGIKTTFIYKINNNGELLNKTIINSNNYEKILSCNIDHSDSSIVLTGSKYIDSANGLDGLLMKINMEGNIIWRKVFGDTGGEVIWDSEIDYEGNYILSGTSTLSSSGSSAIIRKVDKNGQLLYAHYFEDFPYSGSKNILKKSNDMFTVIGRSGNHSGHKDNKLLILNLNKDSTPNSHKIISKSIGIEGKLSIENNEGEILVVGITNRRNIFKLKL